MPNNSLTTRASIQITPRGRFNGRKRYQMKKKYNPSLSSIASIYGINKPTRSSLSRTPKLSKLPKLPKIPKMASPYQRKRADYKTKKSMSIDSPIK